MCGRKDIIENILRCDSLALFIHLGAIDSFCVEQVCVLGINTTKQASHSRTGLHIPKEEWFISKVNTSATAKPWVLQDFINSCWCVQDLLVNTQRLAAKAHASRQILGACAFVVSLSLTAAHHHLFKARLALWIRISRGEHCACSLQHLLKRTAATSFVRCKPPCLAHTLAKDLFHSLRY